jgi:nucleoside-diphosphate-sugar epimerase
MSRDPMVLTRGGRFGSHLRRRLQEDVAEVLGLDNFSTGTPSNIAHLTKKEPCCVVRHDVSDSVRAPRRVDPELHVVPQASPIDNPATRSTDFRQSMRALRDKGLPESLWERAALPGVAREGKKAK